MTHRPDPLSELAYWETWQYRVVDAWPSYAAQGMFVDQDVDPDEVARVAAALQDPVDRCGQARDVAHGGRVFRTALGPVTRMWVDGNVEIQFLRETLGGLDQIDVLDIGAGYGRLAVMLAPLVSTYACVDAVPVSVQACRAYTSRYRPSVAVLDIDGLRLAMRSMEPLLAINVHSWNECTRAQISRWLDVLDALSVPMLFTVSHGRGKTAWRTCEPGEPSFKPLIAERYALVRECEIGIGLHPHALWRRP